MIEKYTMHSVDKAPVVTFTGIPLGQFGFEMLIHMMDMLRELSAAVDAFSQAGDAKSQIYSFGPPADGSDTYSNQESGEINSRHARRRYLETRQIIAAKAAVLAVDQLISALKLASLDDQRLCAVVGSAHQSFPDAEEMRDAVAHLDARRRRRWKDRGAPASLPPLQPGETARSSVDHLIWGSLVVDDDYLLPLRGDGSVLRHGRFAMTADTVNRAKLIMEAVSEVTAGPYAPRPY